MEIGIGRGEGVVVTMVLVAIQLILIIVKRKSSSNSSTGTKKKSCRSRRIEVERIKRLDRNRINKSRTKSSGLIEIGSTKIVVALKIEAIVEAIGEGNHRSILKNGNRHRGHQSILLRIVKKES